jgi:hypothetical protein
MALYISEAVLVGLNMAATDLSKTALVTIDPLAIIPAASFGGIVSYMPNSDKRE